MLKDNSKMVVLIYSLLVAMVALSCSYKISEEENKDTNEVENTAAYIEREIDVLLKLTEEDKSLLAKAEKEVKHKKMKKTENLLENENDEYDESEINIRKEDAWWFSRRRTTTTYRSATCLGPNRSRCNIGLHYNGCGSQVFKMLSTNILHKQDLEGACNKHGVCYNKYLSNLPYKYLLKCGFW